MTFDEVIKRLSQDIDKNGGQEKYQKEVITTLKLLQKEYAPMVEMTKNQYRFITSEYEEESVVYAVANLTSGDSIKETFHSNFWAPLSEKQVVQAWLHPETIKVVD